MFETRKRLVIALTATPAAGHPSWSDSVHEEQAVEGSDLGKNAAEYLRYLELIRNCSPNTITSYRSNLKDLLLTLHAVTGTAELSVEHLTPALLRRFVSNASQRELSAATLSQRISVARSFCKWLVRQQRLAQNPASGLRAPRVKKSLPRALSYAELTSILGAPRLDTAFGCRDASMLSMLYSSGIRVSELAGLNLEDVDMGEGLAKVRRGKGGRDRFAVVGPNALEALRHWLSWREKMARTIPVDPSAVYLNCDGQRFGLRSISRMFRSHADSAKLDRRFTAHGLRHSCASHMLANGACLVEIKELLGHRNLQTTTIYARLTTSQLREVLQHNHPRA